jgi:hypothetical protein
MRRQGVKWKAVLAPWAVVTCHHAVPSPPPTPVVGSGTNGIDVEGRAATTSRREAEGQPRCRLDRLNRAPIH